MCRKFLIGLRERKGKILGKIISSLEYLEKSEVSVKMSSYFPFIFLFSFSNCHYRERVFQITNLNSS